MTSLPLRAVFDSNILIDLLNGMSNARATMIAVPERYVSVVARAEVLSGAVDDEARSGAHRLFAQCRMIDVSIEIADKAAMIRRESRLKLPAALIAATAAVLAMPLLTRDIGMITPGGDAIIPYRV